jgi:hypothetical protein
MRRHGSGLTMPAPRRVSAPKGGVDSPWRARVRGAKWGAPGLHERCSACTSVDLLTARSASPELVRPPWHGTSQPADCVQHRTQQRPRWLPCPCWSTAVRVGANKALCAASAESGTRQLSDQLSDYRVDDPYIQAHLHGPSSRLVLDLDDSPNVLRGSSHEHELTGTMIATQPRRAASPGLSRAASGLGRTGTDVLGPAART